MREGEEGEGAIGCVQISYYYRLIGPGEYDTAVQCFPAACPLAAMGDLRTGQQVSPGSIINVARQLISHVITPW